MYIVSLCIENRKEEVYKIQEILTEYGDSIETRIGLHSLGKSKQGLILIVYNNEKNVENFVKKLKKLNNLSINYMKT